MQTLNDAVERVWHAAQLIMWQDYLRMDQRKTAEGRHHTSLMGKENNQARGMIYGFFDNWTELAEYAPTRTPITDEQGFIRIFDGGFVKRLSAHLDTNSDYGRAIVPDVSGNYCLSAISNFKGMDSVAKKKIETILDDVYETSSQFAEMFGHEEAGKIFSMEKTYSALLSDSYNGFEATRTESALLLTMSTGKPVILSRQRVPEDSHSVNITVEDPASKNERLLKYSRLGTGELMLLSPEGLKRSGKLKLHEHEIPGCTLNTLQTESGQKLHVVFELTEYRFDSVLKKVVPIGPSLPEPAHLFQKFYFK